ncbi:MAG: protein kinase domain-containing protein, partial [Planctomycetota bacterium]
MGDASWDRIKSIAAEALDHDPDERAAIVDRACGSDDALRANVLELIAYDHGAKEVLEPPTASFASPAAVPMGAGARIGRYTVRRTIASGGMGTVYEAVQDHPHRAVAIKVLLRAFVSSSTSQRFKHEAEILGRLRHPNIAQVHDAGTFDAGEGGQPYFAMELIKGRPLVAYAEAESLDTRQRLELFVKVCKAVQYAHQMGVIHRDLKPDNILVDDFGEPKILDFGVARATNADIRTTTLRTNIGELIGTVPYMSPEQVRGDPDELDTRSDVYSLGVVLYELLAGRLPHDLRNRTVPEAVWVIGQEDHTPLSSVNRSFRGDLDTIVSKALEKDRSRRYQSAGDLASDLSRHLRDEPIVARPASTLYQLRKFARRHKALVGGASLAVIALAIGTVVSSWQAVQARREATRQRATNEFAMRLFALANPGEAADDLALIRADAAALTLEELVLDAASHIEADFAAWPDLQGEMHHRVGKTLFGLTRFTEAQAEFERAYELRAQTLGAEDPRALESLMWIGIVTKQREESTAAIPHLQRAYDGFLRAFGPGDPHTVMAATELATVMTTAGRLPEADELLSSTIEIARRELGPDHDSTLMAVVGYAYTLGVMGRDGDVISHTRDALAHAQARYPGGHYLVARLAYHLGWALMNQGSNEEATEFIQLAYDWEHGDVGRAVGNTAMGASDRLTEALRRAGRPDEAERIALQQAEACREQLGDDHEYTAWSAWSLGQHYITTGQPEKAEPVLHEAHDHFRVVLGRDNSWTLWLAQARANALRDLGRVDEAASLYREAADGRLRLQHTVRAAWLYFKLAQFYFINGQIHE